MHKGYKHVRKLINKNQLFVILIACVLYFGTLYAADGNFRNSINSLFGFGPSVTSLEDVTVFRTDITANVISDIEDENGIILFYGLRFYSDTGEKISDIVAVATSSVEIDEYGQMSIQIIDDAHTVAGAVYASVYLEEKAVDSNERLSNEIEVGDPCIVTEIKEVYVCDSYPFQIDPTLFNESVVDKKAEVAFGGIVGGIFFEIKKPSLLLADATEAQKSLRRPSPSQPKTPSTPPKAPTPPAPAPSAKKHTPKKDPAPNNPPKKKKDPAPLPEPPAEDESENPSHPLIFTPTEPMPPITTEGRTPPVDLPPPGIPGIPNENAGTPVTEPDGTIPGIPKNNGGTPGPCEIECGTTEPGR